MGQKLPLSLTPTNCGGGEDGGAAGRGVVEQGEQKAPRVRQVGVSHSTRVHDKLQWLSPLHSLPPSLTVMSGPKEHSPCLAVLEPGGGMAAPPWAHTFLHTEGARKWVCSCRCQGQRAWAGAISGQQEPRPPKA